MPLLSIVLVVGDEPADLDERVAGLVGPELEDVELIAVDDASPAATAAALDALARSDARIRVVHRAERTGIGRRATSGSSTRQATTSGSSRSGRPRARSPASPSNCGRPRPTCCSLAAARPVACSRASPRTA